MRFRSALFCANVSDRTASLYEFERRCISSVHAAAWLGLPTVDDVVLLYKRIRHATCGLVNQRSVVSLQYFPWARTGGESEPVGNVGRQLLDLRVVVPLDVPHAPHVPLGQEVDRHTFAAKAPTAPDAVKVVLDVRGQVVVDHEGDLLDVDASCQQ